MSTPLDSSVVQNSVPRHRRVAIVGAGPAGVSAARELCKVGFFITLFDKEARSGGLKRYGYPSFRMPSSISDREATELTKLGVIFHGGAELGKTVALDDLERDFGAVLLATGAPVARKLGIPGEDLSGVYDALHYLYYSRTEQSLPTGPRVLIVGGGDTAVDAATTALFLGAQSATILVRRGEEHVASQPHEIKFAHEKGVIFRFWSAPLKISSIPNVAVQTGGKSTNVLEVEITATQLKGSMLVVTDTTKIVQFDTVIVAIGQERNSAFLTSLGVKVAEDGSTNHPNVFVAGGSLYGSRRLANAILDGRRVAQLITTFLSRSSD